MVRHKFVQEFLACKANRMPPQQMMRQFFSFLRESEGAADSRA